MNSLEPSALIELRLWQKRETLHYAIKRELLPDGHGLSADCFEAMSILLDEMLSSEKGVNQRFWRLASERKQVLEFFRLQEWALQNDAGLWQLTPLGRAAVEVRLCLHSPRPILTFRKDIPPEELSTWEIIVSMDAANFRHMVKDRSKNDIPYDPTAAGEKVWYTKPSERSVCREYLLALLRGDLVVPHWKPTAFYKCLLDGLEYEPPVKHLKLQLRDDWDPDDMHAGAVSKPLKASKPPRKRAVRQLENEDDECVDADSLASPASPDALLVPDLVEVPAVLDAGAGAMPPEQMSSSSSSRSSSRQYKQF